MTAIAVEDALALGQCRVELVSVTTTVRVTTNAGDLFEQVRLVELFERGRGVPSDLREQLLHHMTLVAWAARTSGVGGWA